MMPSMMPSISRSLSRLPHLPQARASNGARGVTPHAKNRPAAADQRSTLPQEGVESMPLEAAAAQLTKPEAAAHHAPTPPGHPAREEHARRALLPRERYENQQPRGVRR